MPQATIRVKSPITKSKERSIVCRVRTMDGRILVSELPVLLNVLVDEKSTPGHAYLPDENNLYLAEDGTYQQMLHEGDHIPICTRAQNQYTDGKKDNEEYDSVSNQLFDTSRNQAQAEVFDEINKSDHWNKIIWAISIVFGALLMFAAMNYFGG